MTWGAVLLMLGLTAVFGRGFPPADPGVRLALAFCLAWIITTPVYYPWYEMMILPLLALMPASRLDWPIVLRPVIAVFGVVPGAFPKFEPAWLSSITRDIVPSFIVKPGLLVLAVILVIVAWRRSWNEPPVVAVGKSVATARSARATA
jgi:hypothetical protein